MSGGKQSIPIFPLGPEAVWEDVLNAIEASVQYQSEHGGTFGPLFAFAPMTEPDDPDRWEPLAVPPLHLLLVSASRTADATMLKVFARAEPQIGALHRDSPGSRVKFAWEEQVAVLYDVMEEQEVVAYRFSTGQGADDCTFFCVRGADTALALNEALRAVLKEELG